MQVVVCQLVGIGMVPQYVMNGKLGPQCGAYDMSGTAWDGGGHVPGPGALRIQHPHPHPHAGPRTSARARARAPSCPHGRRVTGRGPGDRSLS
jgi:hypothetical protein